MSEQKSLQGVEVKDAQKGTVEAVFATLDVIDKDGDITVKGAFGDQQVRISAYGHESWKGALPVGRGVIREQGAEAILEGQFFLDTDHGRNTFETVKGLGELSEWSYGFDVVEKGDPSPDESADGAVRILRRLKVHEVSPVLIGAGVNTRTLAVKERPSFPDEVESVLGDMKAIVARVQGWGSDSESKEGRVLSAANRERLITLEASLGETLTELRGLLAETEPNKAHDVLREFLRYEHLRAAI